MEPKIEHRRAGRLRDLDVDGRRLGMSFVALTAEQERIELDVDSLAAHLAGPEPESPEIDRAHRWRVALRRAVEENSAAVTLPH